MSQQRTLSSTQIRYLRIGPKVNQSNILKQQLINALQQEQHFQIIFNRKREQGAQFSMGIVQLRVDVKNSHKFRCFNQPKFRESINITSNAKIRQISKISGQNNASIKRQTTIINIKKNTSSRVVDNNNSDKRTVLKSIYNYQGEKIFVVLNSFSIQAVGQNYKQMLPFSLVKLLITHVNSSKLTRLIESSYQMEGEQLSLNISKVQQKCAQLSNNQQKYHNTTNKFQKFGYQFKISLPSIQFTHVQSQFKHVINPKNKDILGILQQQFDNVHDIVYKYFDHEGFTKILQANHSFQQNNSNFNDDSPHKEISDIRQNEQEEGGRYNQMQEQGEGEEDQQDVQGQEQGQHQQGQQQQGQQQQGQQQQGQQQQGQQQQGQQQQGQQQQGQQQQGQQYQQQQEQGQEINQQQQNQSQITPQ